MNPVLIFGHQKPDTDAICGAIALSYLKNKLNIDSEPRTLSEINKETKYALDYFNFDEPKYLNDVKIQIKDINYKKNCYVSKNKSIYETYEYIIKEGITGIPIVDSKRKFVGYVSLKEIAKDLILSSETTINTNFMNIVKTLNSKRFYKKDNIINGVVTSLSNNKKDNLILISNNLNELFRTNFLDNIKLIILTNDYNINDVEFELIKKKNINLIITTKDLYKTIKIINLSNPIDNIKRNQETVNFLLNDYLTYFKEQTKKLSHNNYPVLDNKGKCMGMLTLNDINNYNKKKVILVDHNDFSQSADGINEAEILEIVDHHNIGNINTTFPINFRNMKVGSVNTIIYYMFLENKVKIPKNIAGIMLSGIISDTLLLKSPTTTHHDKLALEKLSKIARLDFKTYGEDLLKSGISIKGLNPEEVIYKDFKSFDLNGIKIGIGQVFATTFTEYEKDIDIYVKTLDDLSSKLNYKVMCLFVTDIFSNHSYLIYNNSVENILKRAFNLKEIYQGVLVRDIMSRKIQIVPPILQELGEI